MQIARKAARTWQTIAEEASRETDSSRLIELSEELDRALEAEQPTSTSADPNAA